MPLALMVHDSIQDLTSLLDNSNSSSNNSCNNNNNKPTNLVHNKLKKDDQTLINQSKKKTTMTNNKKMEEANPQQPPSFFRYAGQYEYSENYYYHHPSSYTSSTSGTGSDQNTNHNTGTSSATTPLPSTNTDTNEYENDDDWLAEGRRNTTSVPVRNNGNPLLHCLFPWIFRQQSSSITKSNKNLAWSVNDVDHDDHDDSINKEDDGSASNNSNQLGEKLSQRERLALLNRLRLPVDATQQLTSMDKHGTTTTNTTTTTISKTNLLNGIPVQATSPLDQPPPSPPRSNGPLKGILKHSDTTMSSCSNGSTTGPMSSSTALTKQTSRSAEDNNTKGTTTNCSRRSLFPTTYEKRTNKAVTFAPMARVVTVKSKNDMDAEEKSSVWWQRSDYEEFRRMGRIITKSTAVTNPGLLINQQEHAVLDQLHQQQQQQHHQKWWHNFGHSRRGLEHVVSSDEGRQRQENVKAAIAAVLKEQARGTTDSEKLRAVSLTYTSWARDLAEAAAASDADAVARGFGEDRKSREFFLLKQFQKQPQKYGPTIVPDFMQPRTKTKLQQRLLDANISRRPLQRRPLAATALSLSSTSSSTQQPPHPTAILSKTTTAASSSSSSNNNTVVVVEDSNDNNNSNDNMVVMVKDSSDDTTKNEDDSTSMAHQAAGFAADGKKHDMAAVLAGAAMVVN